MRNRIKILFLIDYLHGFGGTERHLFQLATRLDSQQFECVVSPFRSNDEMIGVFRQAGIQVIPFPIKRIYGVSAVRQASALHRFIRENKISIVQTFNRDSDIFGTFVAKQAGAPVIISSRRDLGTYRKKRHLIISKMTNRYVDRFIAVCEAVAQNLIEQERVNSDKVTTIYNGFDLSDMRPVHKNELADKLEIDADGFVVGSIAHFRPEKGYNIFFEAIRQIKSLAVGGGEPLFSRFKDEIAANGLNDFVTLPGYVSNVSEYVSLMDVCCLTPVSNEGFSNALLEQMAFKKAIVATDIGGNREAITDGESGLIIPANDSQALAEAILKLYRDKKLRKSLGENARNRVEKMFDIKKMIGKTETLYLDVIREKANHLLN